MFGDIQLEDERVRLVNSGYFSEQEVFRQLDRKMTDKVLPTDIINFLGVHRIATNERECQYLIWLTGSSEPYLSHNQYITNYQGSSVTSLMDRMTTFLPCRAQGLEVGYCLLMNCSRTTAKGKLLNFFKRKSSTIAPLRN